MVAVVFGRRGSGKSVLGKHKLRERAREIGAAGIMADTLLEHDDLALVDMASLPAVVERSRGGTVRVAVPDEAAFLELRRTLEACRRPAVLAVDELSFWSKPAQTTPGLSDLIRYGRHWQIDLIGISRRAAETSREFTSQADELCIFAIHEPRDQAYFAEILPAEACAKLPSLDKFCYVSWKVSGTYEVCPPVNF